MEHQNRMAIAIVLASIFVGSLASRNTSTPTAFRPGLTNGVDSLTSLGDITTRLVSTLVEAEGEQVDIYGMANFVTALSKAATIVEHPDMYQDLTSSGHDEELAELTATVKGLAQQQKNLQEKVDHQQEQLQVIDSLATQLNHSQTIIERLEDELEEQGVNEDSDFVGFTAWADVSDYYSSGSTLKFPRVLFNYGSSYDQYTGKFTCPYSGIYSVNAHIEERNAGGLLIKLMLDTDFFNKIHVHDDSTDHGTSSSSVMVGCRQGQQLHVVTEDSGSDAEIQSIEKRCIFSVYLIKKMADGEVRAGNLMQYGSGSYY